MTTVAGVDLTLGNFIGGAFRPGGARAQAVIDPATTEVLAEVAGSTPADVDAAVAAAGDAFDAWAATSPAERSAAILAIAQVIEDNAEALERPRVGATWASPSRRCPRRSVSPSTISASSPAVPACSKAAPPVNT